MYLRKKKRIKQIWDPGLWPATQEPKVAYAGMSLRTQPCPETQQVNIKKKKKEKKEKQHSLYNLTFFLNE